MPAIGIDVGNVLINGMAGDASDTSFRSDNYMKTPAIEGAFDAVRELVERFGAPNVHIVSKCGQVIERKTRLWMGGNGFYAHTGFDVANLHFCLKRPDKAVIATSLQLAAFVDDRSDVLHCMGGIVPHRLLFGPQRDGAQETRGLKLVADWNEALTYFRLLHAQWTVHP
jgi:hypothetical protein